jgi:hypothetical protein
MANTASLCTALKICSLGLSAVCAIYIYDKQWVDLEVGRQSVKICKPRGIDLEGQMICPVPQRVHDVAAELPQVGVTDIADVVSAMPLRVEVAQPRDLVLAPVGVHEGLFRHVEPGRVVATDLRMFGHNLVHNVLCLGLLLVCCFGGRPVATEHPQHHDVM